MDVWLWNLLPNANMLLEYFCMPEKQDLIKMLWLLIVPGVVGSTYVQDIVYQNGETALLPCDITSNNYPGDHVTLLLWYKESPSGGRMGPPIYRSRHNMVANSTEPVLGLINEELIRKSLLSFNTQLSPASLIISNVSESDGGLYRCRVDFLKSQTKTERVNLMVTVSPSRPQIFDDNGMKRDIFAGPYEEGSEVRLSCKVMGGKPAPKVVWFKDFKLLGEQYVMEEDPLTHQLVTYNNITLLPVSRSELHSNITCEAKNYNGFVLQKTIILDIIFLPVKIGVPEKNIPVLAGTEKTFTCQAFWSRPAALLSWWLGPGMVTGGKVTSLDSTDGMTSTSTLTITPREEDTNSTITCQAINPAISHGALQETWKLNVIFPPKIHLERSSTLEEKAIIEGDDVMFHCRIFSNPKINRIVKWYHNGKRFKENERRGIIMNLSGTTLVLKAVYSSALGNYTCREDMRIVLKPSADTFLVAFHICNYAIMQLCLVGY